MVAFKEKSRPAFMFYASDMLSDRRFRMMSLGGRGLLITMYSECWVNGSVPSDPKALAQLIGLPPDEVLAALTPDLLSYFEEHDGELKSPDVERYRDEVKKRGKRQSVGGQKGAKARWQGDSKPIVTPMANPLSTPMANPLSTPMATPMASREERSREEIRRKESLGHSDLSTESNGNNEWVAAYAAGESAS
jgi:hypothetical protein